VEDDGRWRTTRAKRDVLLLCVMRVVSEGYVREGIGRVNSHYIIMYMVGTESFRKCFHMCVVDCVG